MATLVSFRGRDTGVWGATPALSGLTLDVVGGGALALVGPTAAERPPWPRSSWGLAEPHIGARSCITGRISPTSPSRSGPDWASATASSRPPRFKGITVHDLLLLAAGKEKLTKDQCCQYLTRVGLCANDYLEREVDVSLSGGEVKRIEIATILARQGSLMIFDEPEAGIDLWSFARLTETFEQIHSQGSATMIIIPSGAYYFPWADEVIVVGDGTLRHRGTPKEILPRILTDTLGGCPVLNKEVHAL